MNRDIWFAEQPLFKLDSTKFLWNLCVSSPSGGEAFGAVRHGLQEILVEGVVREDFGGL